MSLTMDNGLSSLLFHFDHINRRVPEQVIHFNGILSEKPVLGGGITQRSSGIPEKRLPKVWHFHSPSLHLVSPNRLSFEGNKSTILTVLLCARVRSGAATRRV